MVRTALAAAAVAIPLAAVAQALYKWVDAKGITHYSQEPPPDGTKATKVDVKPTPPSSRVAPEDPASWKARAREMEQDRHDRESAEARASAVAQHDKAVRAQRCRAARVSQDHLVNSQQVWRYDDKGRRQYIADDQRAAELEKQNKIIEQNCN